jgi:hypothetical protein
MLPHDVSNRSCPEDWEYEYEQPEDQPRTPQEPSLAPSAPENYPQDKNYTHRSADAPDIDSLAEDLAGASISPVAGSYPPSGVYPSTASSGSYPPSGIYPSTASSGTYPTAGTGAYPSAASTGTFPSLASAGTYSGAATYSAQSYGQQTYASPTPGWQNHIKTRDPYTDREEFDPREQTVYVSVLCHLTLYRL